MSAPTAGLAAIPVMKPWLGDAEAAAAAEAVRSGWVAQGPRVAAFEVAVAARVGARHAIAVSSCTTGLHLALIAAGVGPGDEVVVPSLSFIATANAARYVSATPVFADVDMSGNLTADSIASVLTARTKAVILVHQGGMPADVDAVHALCDPRRIEVIEDAACAIGSTYRGREIGAHSGLVVFSFHPRKVITTGEGGMVFASDERRATRIRQLREHSMSVSAAERHASNSVVLEQYLETGYNYRMTDIQAAVGLVQLDRLDEIVARRRAMADRYRALLSDVRGLLLPGDPPYGTTNYQSYQVVLTDEYPISRNELLERLFAQGISGRRGIMASHLEPAYADNSPRLPVTEFVTSNGIILPMFHVMTDEEQDRVAAVIRDVT